MKKESVLETLTMILEFMEKIQARPSRIADLKAAIEIVSETDDQREKLLELFR